MKTLILLSALLAGGVAASAQPADAPAKLVNDSLFRVITPEQAQTFKHNIAIHLRDVTLERALSELQNQSDVPLDWSNLQQKDLDAKLSIDVETPSFKRAFDEIVDEANVALDLAIYGEPTPHLVMRKIPANSPLSPPAENPDAPISVDGLFSARLKKLEVVRLKSFDWSRGATLEHAQDDHLSVVLQPAFDARLPLVGPSRLRITRAEDEQGRSVVPAPGAEKAPFYFFSMGNLNPESAETLNLLAPQNDARQLAHLEGVAIYVLVAAQEKWEVPVTLDADGWKASHSFKNGGQEVRLAIQGVERKGENLEMKFTMSAPTGSEWGTLGNPLFSSSAALAWMHFEDANGAILRGKGGGGGVEGNFMNGSATFILPQNRKLFPRGGFEPTKLALPVKFVFDAPTEFVQTEVPFSFQNVPLP